MGRVRSRWAILDGRPLFLLGERLLINAIALCKRSQALDDAASLDAPPLSSWRFHVEPIPERIFPFRGCDCTIKTWDQTPILPFFMPSVRIGPKKPALGSVSHGRAKLEENARGIQSAVNICGRGDHCHALLRTVVR